MGIAQVVEKISRYAMGFRAFLVLLARKCLPPPRFLKRYDSKRVRGWGSANDMIPWELDGQASSPGEEGGRNPGVGTGEHGRE